MLDFQKEALSAFRSLGRWQAILMFTMVSQPVMSHIEAYPRLNVREARKQVRDGRDVVSWRDRHGAIVGVGRTRLLDGNRLSLDYRFREHGDSAACDGEVIFECSIRNMAFEQEDFLTICMKCGTRVRTLLLLECEWVCSHCQPLAHRSKLVGDLVRKSERFAELDRLIQRGRPKGMHSRTFLKLRDERFQLKLELGDHRGKARSVYDEEISSYWSKEGTAEFDLNDVLPAEQSPAGIASADRDEVEGDEPLLTLAGAPLFAGPSLTEALDDQLLRLARRELSVMTAQGVVPTAMRLRKRLAAKTFNPPPQLERDSSIRILGAASELVLEARYDIRFSGNDHYFLMTPDGAIGRHPVAVISDGGLLLKTKFKRDEARFIPVIIEEECELIEHLLGVQQREIEAYNRAMKLHVRRLVKAHWDALIKVELDEHDEPADEGTSAGPAPKI